VFFKLIKVHLLVSELYKNQNAPCNDKNLLTFENLNIPNSNVLQFKVHRAVFIAFPLSVGKKFPQSMIMKVTLFEGP
jgi:hypothetical protein